MVRVHEGMIVKGFNSATAVNRGEHTPASALNIDCTVLQFGHGGEPWRTAQCLARDRLDALASIRPRR